MSALKKAVDFLRQVMGEQAYARYCEHLRRTGRSQDVPTPQAFYLDGVERRYSQPSRCC